MSQYQLDAYSAIEGVRTELASFLRSTFRFAAPALDAAVHEAIWKTGLLAPRVVEPTFPYEEASKGPRTMADLAACGDVHADLVSLLARAEGDASWPATRPLYTHQVQAIKAYRDGKSIVVASGTGSGKTECFLLPTIDTVLRDADLAKPGVRVLLVYPLNALVNNQMDRLRAILGHHPDIRFALYTRRLAETQRIAERNLRRSGRVSYPAEVISREMLRAHPPHIVVTNFSMLEYSLVRPVDASLFAPRCDKPRLCVLDEAHVYAGSLAAELTLLLRRAWLRWGLAEAPQGIVTSATMFQGVDDGPAKLLRFATDLLSKRPGSVVSIVGKRVLPPDEGPNDPSPLPAATALAKVTVDFPTLTDCEGDDHVPRTEFDTSALARDGVDAVLALLGKKGRPSTPPALDLWSALEPLGWVRALRRELHDARAERLDRVAAGLFPDAPPDVREHAVLNLLAVLAIARPSPGALPLLPVRLHAVVRGPHGIYACINGACERAASPGRIGALYPDHVANCACGATTLELRVCEGCGQSYLGATEGADDDELPALLRAGRDVTLFVSGATWDDGAPIAERDEVHVYPNGRIAPRGEGFSWSRFDGGRVRGATKQLVDVACPKCDHTIPAGAVLRRVEAGTDAALQIVVDGLYPALPMHAKARASKLPGDGRRALLFADNRQVAAALAAKIEESHDIVLSRVLLWRALQAAQRVAVSPETARLQDALQVAIRERPADVPRIVEQMAHEARSAASHSVGYNRLRDTLAQTPGLSEASTFEAGGETDLAAMIITRELGRRPARRGNLEAVGVVAVVYNVAVAPPSHPDVLAAFQLTEWCRLVEVLLDILRTSGFVRPPVLSPRAKQQLQLRMLGKELIRSGVSADDEEDDDDEVPVRRLHLVPSSVGRTTRLSSYIEKVLSRRAVAQTVTPLLVLAQLWETLAGAARVPTSPLVATAEVLSLPIDRLSFRTAASTDQWRCPTCKTVWAREVSCVCPTSRCDGTLVALARGDLDPRERLVSLTRFEGPVLGLRTEEHTAQIGVERLEEREQDFKDGKVNVLTSSTTMELGIDIGGLSATVLTNVPPGASNYLQRAGRAGRRSEGTSLVLTYARPRPFDQAAFEEPLKPFRERIVPPVVRLDAERIVRRHLNAFLLAYFFRSYEAQGDVPTDPMSALRTAGDFFFRPLGDVLSGHARMAELVELGGGQGATLADAFVGWLSDAPANLLPLGTSVVDLVRGTSLEAQELAGLATACVSQVGRISANARTQRAFLQERLGEERARPQGGRDSGAITALELQLADLEGARLLGFLAEEQFLPRYGFPVQVVSLDHRFQGSDAQQRPVEEDDFELRLSRDISLAVSEYAPGADIVAAKAVHRSAGLLRHWTGSDAPGVLASRVVAVCGTCGQLQYGRTEGEIRRPCPTCGEGEPRCIRVLEPKHGFAVQWGRAPKRWIGGIRPPLRPVTDSAYAARDGQHELEVSPGLSIGYDEEGQILVRAEGQLDPTDLPGAGAPQAATPRAGYGYAICYLCGRAEPETAPGGNTVPVPGSLRGHRRLRGDARCEATTQFWRHTALAGAVRTETLAIQLRGPAQLPQGPQGARWATTWMVALQLSAGEVLGIDSRSFGSLLVPRATPNGFVLDALLYDQIAGGAGLCRALRDRWRELLEVARHRLDCANPLCTHGCHRCLIAFETQRYEDAIRRSELAAFLETHWEDIVREPVRAGVRVAALMRGKFELLELLKRAPAASVTVVTRSVAPDALDEGGWLRPLLLHAEAGGRLRILLQSPPDPNRESFLARRLAVAVGPRCEIGLVRSQVLAEWRWNLIVTDPDGAFLIDNALDAGLGPDWVPPGSSLFSALDAAARGEIMARANAMASSAEPVTREDLEPEPPPPTVKWQYVPAGAPASRSTFAHWLRGPDGNGLFARPVAEVTLVDPYIANDAQLTLLRELCDLARTAGCTKFRVDTYPPEVKDFNVRADEQVARIRTATGDPTWTPNRLPERRRDRAHKRLLRGSRPDGTKFEVLFERGIDFLIPPYGRSPRTTRETFIIVREPV